jgi:intracellular sulfur oxidation DsrE/DsrF family protein
MLSLRDIRMKTLLNFIVLTAVMAAAASGQQANSGAPAKHKVVLQMNVDGKDSWNQLLGNVNNLREAFKADGVQIEVVFYGKGITALLKTNTEYKDRLEKIAGQGVVLAACQNSMRARKIVSADIFPFSTEVDSGAAELVRKQEAGYSYIRAGE